MVRRTRPAGWSPGTIPTGLLIALLGAWVFFVPLVGPYFDFGFETDSAWSFTQQHWLLSLIPGAVAAGAGLLMMVPSRISSSTLAFLAAAAGVWLIVGPTLYPLFSSDVEPSGGSETMQALLWIGYFYGPGALITYLAGMANGMLARRVPTDVEYAPVREPIATDERVVTDEPVVVEERIEERRRVPAP